MNLKSFTHNMKLLILLTFFVLSNSQVVFEPFQCSNFKDLNNCNIYQDYGCAWCESLSYCGTCDSCTSELIVGGSTCPGEYTQCFSVIKCATKEIVSYILMFLFVLLFIGCLILCMLPLYQNNSLPSKIILIILGIVAVIGGIMLAGSLIAIIFSIFTISEGDELFKWISGIMLLYIVLVCLVAFVILILAIIVLVVIFLIKKLCPNTANNVDYFDL